MGFVGAGIFRAQFCAGLDPKIGRFIPVRFCFNRLVPAGNTEQRKLVAIMLTDMVGYGALAQCSDQLPLEPL